MQTIITIIAMFFISADFNKIVAFFKAQIPESKKEIVLEAKVFFINTLPKVILSYGIVLCLTFIELFIGFRLLKIPYASVLALLDRCFRHTSGIGNRSSPDSMGDYSYYDGQL